MSYPLPNDLLNLILSDTTVYTMLKMGERAELPYTDLLEKMVVQLAADKRALHDLLLNKITMTATPPAIVQVLDAWKSSERNEDMSHWQTVDAPDTERCHCCGVQVEPGHQFCITCERDCP